MKNILDFSSASLFKKNLQIPRYCYKSENIVLMNHEGFGTNYADQWLCMHEESVEKDIAVVDAWYKKEGLETPVFDAFDVLDWDKENTMDRNDPVDMLGAQLLADLVNKLNYQVAFLTPDQGSDKDTHPFLSGESENLASFFVDEYPQKREMAKLIIEQGEW